MIASILSTSLLICFSLFTASTNAKPALFSSQSGVFGVARGGGLFGDKKEKSETDVAASPDTKMYPPLTTEEIEEWLSHIPVYAVTDSNGAGVVLKPDNDTSVFYFFISPQMANATLQHYKASMMG